MRTKSVKLTKKPLAEQLIILEFAKAYGVSVHEAQNPNNKIYSSFKLTYIR